MPKKEKNIQVDEGESIPSRSAQSEDIRYIYLSASLRVPCTQEQYKAYYQDLDAFRHKEKYHGRCVCPQTKWYRCNADCYNCRYHCAGDIVSLDAPISGEGNEETTWADMLEDDSAPFTEAVACTDEIRQILARIKELLPEAIEYGMLRQQAYAKEACARLMGHSRRGWDYRIKQLWCQLASEFPEFFENF